MVDSIPLTFFRGDTALAGRLYRNTTRWDTRQPAVIVTGSWLTVKEQMPHLYATRLAERGYAAFTFDFTGFGESGGQPRQAEIPDRKIADLIAAADFLSTVSLVEPGTVAHLAVCASAQYGVAAIARGSRVSRFASVAGWFHDEPSVAGFYGGQSGVETRLAAARDAAKRYEKEGVVDMVPAYRAGDESAGMFFELDYYANAARGAVPTWRNEMAEMSWTHWLLFDGLNAAPNVKVPTLMVHSDDCVLPDNARRVYEALGGPKRLHWSRGGQTDFYDQPSQVDEAVAEVVKHFKDALHLG
jgi:uncharacterized protein